MKPTLILSYPVFLLVFIIITPQSTTATRTASAAHVVYDVTGEKVLNNVLYHIGPVIWAKGGGIKLTDTINSKTTCPLSPVQDPAEIKTGGRFKFALVPKREHLRTSSILGIDSGYPKEGSSCDRSTFWQIPDADAQPPDNLITTGGIFDTDVSCFRVVDYPKPTSAKVHSYMLQHCPSFCEGGPPRPCYNVSIYETKGVRFLASTGTPFEFVFQKPK